jgi:4-hydroxy-3-methylbut-2-en-1-yl diphosphate synthase IspG/GcpE
MKFLQGKRYFLIFFAEEIHFGKLLAITYPEYGLKTRVNPGSFGNYLF